MRIASIDEVMKLISAAEMEEMKKSCNEIKKIDISNRFYSRLTNDEVFIAYIAPFAIEKSITVKCAENQTNTDICFSWENKTFSDMIGCDTFDDAVANFQYDINVNRKIKVPGIVNKKTASVAFENGLIIFKCKLIHSHDDCFELRCGKK